MLKFSDIVLIDDGINSEISSSFGAVNLALKNNKIENDIEIIAQDTHGTICARIIREISPYCNLINVRLLDNSRRCDINSLIYVLNWCLLSEAKFINMSLGTIDYFDGEKLRPIISNLIAKGKIIVAAYNNLDIPSYPAILPGVFGVRANKSNKEIKSRLAFDYSQTPTSGSVIMQAPDLSLNEIGIQRYNSFAAAAAMGEIHFRFGSNSYLNSDNLFSLLVKESPSVLQPFNTLRFESNIESEIPIIFISKLNITTEIIIAFKEKGYNVVGFSDKKSDTLIPISHFGVTEITSGFVEVILKHYNPDMLIIERCKPDKKDYIPDLLIDNAASVEIAVKKIEENFL